MNILYKHNAEAYEKVKKSIEKNDRTCIVHATGTGKSFIALQLMMDYLQENPDKHICYVTPLNGIKEQINEHIEALGLPKDIFKNVDFITYSALTTKSRSDLESLKANMLVLDEFHHLGAREWTSAVNKIVESHPDLKIFGMSATSVRERGTSNEDDVAESFFNGNVASRYELEQAIADGVLPSPEYHATLTFLEDECRELEEKVKSEKASSEEKAEYTKIISNIKKQISMLEVESTTDIIRRYIKPDGKYIYFCPRVYENEETIEKLQENFLEMLPEEIRGNVEFYMAHSKKQTGRENKESRYNFYNNLNNNGQAVTNKLRVMFAINMYNEGIHVPDIDGVVMGRSTQSDIIFYQQLGRALAVKKKSDNDEEQITSPLVIDLMDNFRNILKLYQKTAESRETKETTDIENISINGEHSSNPSILPINFGMSEELINILEQLEEVKGKVGKVLSFDEKLEEAYEYFNNNGKLPTCDDKEEKFSDGTAIGSWLFRNKLVLKKLQEENEYAKALIQELDSRKGLTFEEKLNEAHNILDIEGQLPLSKDKETKFSDGSLVAGWLSNNKSKLQKLQEENEYAKALIQELDSRKGLTFEEKLNKAHNILDIEGQLPLSKDKETKFSDGTKMGMFLQNHRDKIEELAKENDETATYIFTNMKANRRLRDNDKITEILRIIEQTGEIPDQNSEICFSNGLEIGSWLARKKGQIIQMMDKSEEVSTLVSTILQLQPDYFERSIKALEAKEDFDSLSVFEKIKNKAEELRKSGTQIKPKQENANKKNNN